MVLFPFAFLFYLALSVGKYLYYNAYAFDLGIFAQASWMISNFQMPLSTIRGVNQFGDHFSPIYILISLPYRLFNSPIYLLVVQSLALTLGGLPIYLLAKEKIGSKLVRLCLLLAYFLQIGIVSAVNFDFHFETLVVPLVSFSVYFWIKKRFNLYLLFLILSLLVKEDVSVLFFSFSLYQMFRKEWRYGLTTGLFSLAWYLISTKLIMPYFLGAAYGYDQIGGVFSGWNIKLETIYRTLGQNAGLSLLDPLGWVFILPNFATRFLSPGEPRWSWQWHYGVNLVGPMIISVTLFLSRVKSSGSQVLLSLVMVGSTFLLGYPFLPKYHQVNVQSVNNLLSKIPTQASVSAQDIFVPHLANRKEIYLFPSGINSQYIILAEGLPSFPINPQQLSESIIKLTSSPQFQVFKEVNYYLLKRR